MDQRGSKELTTLPPPWQRESKYNYRRQVKRPTSSKRSPFNLDLRMFGSEILDYLDWIEPTVQEKAERHCLCSRLTEITTLLWPRATVRVYGSSSSYLMVPGSDIDFVIEDLDVPRESAMPALVQELTQAGMQHVVLVSATKVPVIRFVDPTSGLSCDVSFCTLNAAKSTTLLRKYLSQYPCARPIILVLKTLLRQNNLSTVMSGGLGSYGLALVVISFLRMHEQERNKAKAPRDREKADSNSDTPANVGALFLDFLVYFSSVNATRYVYCAGGQEPRVPKGGRWHLPDKPYLLAVEDPLDPENDVTRGAVNFPYIQSLFVFCTQGIQEYTQRPDQMPSLLSALINPVDPVFVAMGEKRTNCLTPTTQVIGTAEPGPGNADALEPEEEEAVAHPSKQGSIAVRDAKGGLLSETSP